LAPRSAARSKRFAIVRPANDLPVKQLVAKFRSLIKLLLHAPVDPSKRPASLELMDPRILPPGFAHGISVF
jgi:hypothetical protein